MEMNPNLVDAYLRRADIFACSYGEDSWQAAAADYLKAVELDHRCARAYRGLFLLGIKGRNRDMADKYFKLARKYGQTFYDDEIWRYENAQWGYTVVMCNDSH